MKKNLSSKERKSQILSVARTLFAKNGYAETTLDAIAHKAGVTRPRVIQLFGSKLDIYKTIAETAYQDHPMDKNLIDLLAKKDDMAVFEAFALHLLYHTTKREEREIAQILMYARLKNDRFHRIHFKKKDSLMISRLSEYVRERVKEGAFKQVDYRTIIYAYQAMISNLVIYKNILNEMEFVSIEQLSRDCARIFLEGLKNCTHEENSISTK